MSDIVERLNGWVNPDHRVELMEEAACEIEALRKELRRINNVASCGTADSWMSLSDDDKRKWFAQSIHIDGEKAKIIKEQDYQLTHYRSVMEQAVEAFTWLTERADKHLRWDRRFDDALDATDNALTALREALNT